MGLFDRLGNWFSRTGRDENQLNAALDLAKSGATTDAISIYSELLVDPGTSSITKARALFNRALAYSSMKDDTKAIADLQRLVSQEDAPENVRSAARTQLVRLNNRKKSPAG